MYNSDLMPCLLIFSPAHLYIDVIINIESTVHIHEGGLYLLCGTESAEACAVYDWFTSMCIYIGVVYIPFGKAARARGIFEICFKVAPIRFRYTLPLIM
jgi:hypothetical protein